MIKIEELKKLLDYNPSDGLFRWKKRGRAPTREGQVAGWIDSHGYRVIQLKDKNYKAGRLAFFYVHGRWPVEVDHISRIPDDDRICNLREASRAQNCRNIGSKGGKLKLKGVSQRRGKFRATICVNRRSIHLGDWSTPEEAHAAYVKAAKHHFGEFACAS